MAASTNSQLLALPHQAELQIWDLVQAPRCLARLTPQSLKQDKITACAFSSQSEHIVCIGHKDGTLNLFDCRKLEIVKAISVTDNAVSAVQFFNKSNLLLAFTSSNGYVIQGTKIQSEWPVKKQSTEAISVSTNDMHALECFGNSFAVRSLTSLQVTRKETAAFKVMASYWIDKDHFVVAAGPEVTLWSLKSEDPITILDTQTSEPILTLHSKVSSKGRFSVVACSKRACNLFKLNFTQPKKTVAPTSVAIITSEADQYFHAKVLSNTQLLLTYGSIFNLVQKTIDIQEGKFSLTQKIEQDAAKRIKGQQDYDVRDAQMTEHNLKQLPADLTSIEFQKTSTSQKLNGLTTVLQQALQSDDTSQLEWIMKQTEQPLLQLTVKALKAEYVPKLFQKTLHAFQSEQSEQQNNALLWLKAVLVEHWPTVLKSKDLGQLFLVQQFIHKKTCNLDKFVQLKGKIQMCRKQLEIQGVKKQSQTSEPLVYKDASDDDSQSDQEELIEVPLGQKRRHVDEYASEEAENEVDDSVSESPLESDQADEDMESVSEVNDQLASSADEQMDYDSEDSGIVRK